MKPFTTFAQCLALCLHVSIALSSSEDASSSSWTGSLSSTSSSYSSSSSGYYNTTSSSSTTTTATTTSIHSTTTTTTTSTISTTSPKPSSTTSWTSKHANSTTTTHKHPSTSSSYTGSSSKAHNTSSSSTSSTTTPHFQHHKTTVSSQVLSSLKPAQSQIFEHPGSQQPWGPGFVPSGKGNLPPGKQNGKSLLGTLQAPRFPHFISQGNPHPGGNPWGGKTANNTNPYTQAPITGVVRQYDFTLARGTIAPDGVERSVLLINGQFPGPTIEANWGDTFEITVNNNIFGPAEGTSIHWHGLLQTGTPYMDGVPGITQCPIAPGSSATYTFVADLYGTSWYHAHYSAQYAGGLIGAMIIHGPSNAQYDNDLGPVLLTDYYHKDYFTIVEEVMGTDLNATAPKSVNNLINGKGVFNCSLVADATCTPNAGLSKFSFTKGQSYRLRLINAGAEAIQKFSIDGHKLTVMAQDFVPIVPYETDIVTLAVGQRSDVIVTADGDSSGSYWMRSTISSCSLTTQPDGLAIVYYEDADDDSKPETTAWVDNTVPCANDDLQDTVPFFPITPPATPATTETVDINFGVNATGHLLWTMNNSTFRVCYNDPPLLLANEGNTSYPFDPEWNIYNFGSNSSVRLIIENLTPVAHPMHIHGHNAYILAAGAGTWDGSIVNPSNPTRRDVQLVVPNGHIVIQIDSDNPGVWPFHCHIAWHVSGGLYINLMERPDDIAQMDIPPSLSDQCVQWDKFCQEGPVEQIDSGLKKRFFPSSS